MTIATFIEKPITPVCQTKSSMNVAIESTIDPATYTLFERGVEKRYNSLNMRSRKDNVTKDLQGFRLYKSYSLLNVRKRTISKRVKLPPFWLCSDRNDESGPRSQGVQYNIHNRSVPTGKHFILFRILKESMSNTCNYFERNKLVFDTYSSDINIR